MVKNRELQLFVRALALHPNLMLFDEVTASLDPEMVRGVLELIKQLSVDLLKFDSKTQQFNAMKNGRAAALADDNSYLYAWVKNNPKYTVGIKHLGPNSYIAPAGKKGNKSFLDWTNKHINKLNKDGSFVNDYNQELKPYFGDDVRPSDIIINK